MKREVLVAGVVMGLAAPPGFRGCHTQGETGGVDGGTATGGDGGAAECAGDAATCSGPAGCSVRIRDCVAVLCHDGCCSTTNLAAGTMCAAGVCDGNGACVE